MNSMNKPTNTVANCIATKKKYEQPTIEVVELEQTPMILAGSTGSGSGTAGWGNNLSDDYFDE